MSVAEISRQIHLTSPAVTDRIRKLEEIGVITGYSVQLNLRKWGYSFEVLIQITVESNSALENWASAHHEVLELNITTGTQCAMMRVALTSPEHLQRLLISLDVVGKTTTYMVLATSFDERARIHGAKLLNAKKRDV